MEYIEGRELVEVKFTKFKGRLDEGLAKNYSKQVVDSIGYCHREKLIHRGLKLELLE